MDVMRLTKAKTTKEETKRTVAAAVQVEKDADKSRIEARIGDADELPEVLGVMQMKFEDFLARAANDSLCTAVFIRTVW